MADTVIRVENLSKKYIIGHQTAGHSTLRDKITDGAKAIGQRLIHGKKVKDTTREEFWALNDVSFEVKQGDRLGIIGRNGAGKSTLLKILSRITEPTSGQITIHGRVASLLEVGTGFHPELTGRENVFLNGAILGMSRVEIRKKFDEIVDFAEIEKFLDTPVKRYSSGMYVRLAFAVAAHLEPEILIVDEVLAVGDTSFQKKCLGKMDDIADQGRTIVLVSHNMLTIQDLCQKSIWLHHGKLVDYGNSQKITSNYLQASLETSTQRSWEDLETAPGNETVRLQRVCIQPMSNVPNTHITVCDPFLIKVQFHNFKPDAYLNVSLQVHNEYGILVFESAPVHETGWLNRPFCTGIFSYKCHIPGNLLNNGSYQLNLSITENQDILLVKLTNALTFEIADSMENRAGWHGAWDGAVRPILKWETDFVSEHKV
ncbi:MULTISPECIES: ABC transporter ATP-binding protein [Cyanophyceae]|uniref:ABC transporter ATP-binding protein n=1 Tax=Cyanophyceae TaxID=3028117 RepID=UPI0016880136|nr:MULTISPECIES: ABC transporter ATP-binding protein [Cyanophyceae]MBD1918186.1 ABC transporter ATP-binding protein [Phormidium sp. FACHB-77]MBD2030218.1 ABC transporter ATP-binding protein [Phormidium sp. FACHB-322]MBD2051410.1 ABC transporter ATP-binding protein [Leptolyngbya sp. FACHB-60]